MAADADATCLMTVEGTPYNLLTIPGTGKFVQATVQGVYLEAGTRTITIQQESGDALIDCILLKNAEKQDSVSISSELCDPNATEETKNLMQFLVEQYGKTMISGQYVSSAENTELTQIYQITGQLPLIRFADLYGYSGNGGSPEEADAIDSSLEWAERGGIVGLMWHWNAPIGTASVYKDETDFSLANAVTDADIADWYEKQLKSDRELYASNPGQYKDNEEYFEKYCGIYDDAAPALVVPEGYSRIMDIVVIPKGELGDDYKKKNEQLDSLREECTSLLFTDALNGDGANSERIAQLISDYKTLQAECDEMYNKFIEPYRAKIDKAFAELEGGADFAQVMLKYTENEYVAGSDSYGGCETFRTKGQLISTKHSSSKGDWSSTVKEIYSLLKPGEYSDVFTDTDGSLHIIYRGADETPGEIKLADVIDKVTTIVKATSDTEAWDELLDTWMDDADIVYDKDLIASVGKDYVKE